jgi:hypothetical protein
MSLSVHMHVSNQEPLDGKNMADARTCEAQVRLVPLLKYGNHSNHGNKF